MNRVEQLEHRLEIYSRDDFQCQFDGCSVCGFDNLQLAHRIMKGRAGVLYVKHYLMNYKNLILTNKEIENRYIHNELNLITSCPKHNDYFNCLNNPIQANKIIEAIYENESQDF